MPMPISEDDLIEMAMVSYQRQAHRALKTKGEHWPILPQRKWYYEEGERGEEFVVAYHGYGEKIRLRWTGDRFTSAKFVAE
jgi:hypothetical protein